MEEDLVKKLEEKTSRGHKQFAELGYLGLLSVALIVVAVVIHKKIWKKKATAPPSSWTDDAESGDFDSLDTDSIEVPVGSDTESLGSVSDTETLGAASLPVESRRNLGMVFTDHTRDQV